MIQEVYPNEIINKAAEELKKVEAIHIPDWAPFVKTGVHKERPPVDSEWWYHRVAALLRTIYIIGPIGVSKLRVKYGGKKRRGYKPSIFRKGSGSIIRKSLQQLEKAGFIISTKDKKGRMITAKGKSFMDNVALEIIKSNSLQWSKRYSQSYHSGIEIKIRTGRCIKHY